jgi:hypothetical protein
MRTHTTKNDTQITVDSTTTYTILHNLKTPAQTIARAKAHKKLVPTPEGNIAR